jgi:glutamate racemase
MIEPGTEYALSETKTGRIGVIGTNVTINNCAYSKALIKRDPKVQVFEKACPLFVPLAEEGWIDRKATYLIAEEYLAELKEKNIDTLVLGCTHYPLLSTVISDIMGDKVKLIDSGIAAARVVRSELARIGFETNSGAEGMQDFYISDMPQKFADIAETFLNHPMKYVRKVDIESLIL